MKILKPLLHILAPIIAAGGINAYIYLNGWNNDDKKNIPRNQYLPPGYVIAIVWILILGLLGFAHYLTYFSYASVVILLAIIYCLAYPFLTSGLQMTNSAFYNFMAFLMATLVAVSAYSKKQMAAVYTLPFVIWTLYVNIVTNL